MKEIFFLTLTLISLVYGIIDLKNSRKKLDSSFYSGVHYIIMGVMGIITMIFYYFEGASVKCLLMFSLTFIFSGFFGFYFRKSIKNSLTLKMDIAALLAGFIGLIPVVLYFFGFFDK